LFDRKPVNPSAPIGNSAAVARSVGQGRPQAGARALPLTEASTMACFWSVGSGSFVRWAIVAALAAEMMGATINAVLATPVKSQSAPSAATNPADPYAAEIAAAARRFGIPDGWIRAVMRVESRGRVHAVSSKGAIGLMQIMPDTWAGLRLRYRLGPDPYDPRDNILAGAAYLREMRDRFGSPGFLAAYNAGPGRYAEYVSTGRPLPSETCAYVAALAPFVGGGPIDRSVVIATGSSTWIRAPLFIGLTDHSISAEDRPRPDGRVRARSVTDLSGLEPSRGWRSHDKQKSASLFVARTSSGHPR
jgi:soluble lytic murein transglycosylase-like protein